MMTPGARHPHFYRGLVRDWPACETWSAARLAAIAAEMGDLSVSYRSTPETMPEVDLARIAQGKMSLVAFLQECARNPAGSELYIPGLDFPRDSPLYDEIGCPDELDPETVFGTSLFMGRNTKCIGHFHPRSHALLCQVQGVKRVRMVAPEHVHHTYLFPPLSDGFFRSRINYYGDTRAFPDFEHAEVHEFELWPGDALFIPLHWLHVPEGIGWNVSVTHWWRPAWRDWPLGRTSVRTAVGAACELLRQARRGGAARSE